MSERAAWRDPDGRAASAPGSQKIRRIEDEKACTTMYKAFF